VILITLLQSILSVLQPQLFFAEFGLKLPAEVFRQVVFGVVIIGMLLLYGRERIVN
jgi:ribose transport system permease protein